jgi:hypothetical protein
MADYEFTTEDIESLGTKLDGLGQLDDRDRALLLAVFQLAAQQVDDRRDVSGFGMGLPTIGVRAPGNLGLGQGFRNSFHVGPTGGIGAGADGDGIGQPMIHISGS